MKVLQEGRATPRLARRAQKWKPVLRRKARRKTGLIIERDSRPGAIQESRSMI
jgi:hypothetical protein